MNFTDYMLILIMLLCGLYLIIHFICKKIAAFSSNRQTIQIINATEGNITLRGKVQRFDELITAPLSKKPCCGYLYLVIERSDIDRVVDSNTQGVDFILYDGTGKCLIRSTLAGDFCNSILWPPTIRFSNCLSLQEAIERNDLTRIPGNKRYRHMEYRRQEGETVYVSGLYQFTVKDLNLGLLNIKGAVIDGGEKASLTIAPAYPGGTVQTASPYHWLARIFQLLFIVIR